MNTGLVSTTSKNFTIQSAASLEVTFPTITTVMTKGSSYTLTWTSTNVTGNVKLHLYKNGVFLVPIANNEVNDGSYSPFVPGTDLADGTDYQIQMVDVNTGLVSTTSKNFTIQAEVVASPTLTPLYRLYKSSIKDHFYTTSTAERDTAMNSMGFTYERSEGFISTTNFIGAIPLYRLYHTTNDVHFYTSSSTERDAKIALGFVMEKIEGYLYPAQAEWTTPLYYAEHTSNSDHFYTTNKDEIRNAVETWGFAPKVIVGYVVVSLANNRPQGSVAGVNMAVGNLSLPSFTDLSLNGVGPQLAFTRFYDSFSPGTSLGQGWSFNYDSYIQEDIDGIHITWGNGSETHFKNDLTPYPGYFEKIVKIDGLNSGYEVTTKDQTVYKFSLYTLAVPGPNILLFSVTDRHGNQLSLGRNSAAGIVQSAYDESGRTFLYDYSPVSLDDGRIVHRLTKVTDGSLVPNRVVTLGYNNKGNLASVTDARGNATGYSYNADGLLTTITYPEGNSVTVTYNTLQQVTGYTNGTTNLSFTYDSTNGTTVKNGTAILVNYQHDLQYRATAVTFPDASTIKPTYLAGNSLNLQDTVTDRRNNKTIYTYDAQGNVLTEKNALNQVTTYTYDDDNNNLLTVTDPRNYTTTYTYDASKNNIVSISRPASGVTHFTSYSNGLLETVKDPNGHTFNYYYNAIGNLINILDVPLAFPIVFTYDGAGRMLTQTDQRHLVTQYTLDPNNNVTQVKVGGNPAAIYTFNKNNRLTTLTDPRGKITSYTYNTMNLLKTETDPNLKVRQFDYDALGNVKTINEPDGSILSYDYDSITNRLQKINLDGNQKVYFETYDNNGNPTKVTDGNGSSFFVYDDLNRMTSFTDSFGKTVAYDYDDSGNKDKITYPGNKVVNYVYDGDNRLTTVTDWLGSGSTIYSYNNGLLTTARSPKGDTANYSFDLSNRLTGLVNRKANATIISDYALTLDMIGNPIQVVRSTEPISLPAPVSETITYFPGEANELNATVAINYTYDPKGNLSTSSNGNTFSFNYDNRLTSAAVGGQAFQYLYNAFGDRIARTKAGVQTRYVLDLNGEMSQVLAETDSAGTISNYYVYGLGLISKITATGQRSTYHYDPLGSTVAITDDSDNITEKYAYDEFGKALGISETTPNPFRYVGRYGVMDEGNGYLFMRARYYDAEAGKFISKDPLGFGGGDLNVYNYVGGNPLVGIDPSGLTSKSVDATIAAGPALTGSIIYDDNGDIYLSVGEGLGVGTGFSATITAGNPEVGLSLQSSASCGIGVISLQASGSYSNSGRSGDVGFTTGGGCSIGTYSTYTVKLSASDKSTVKKAANKTIKAATNLAKNVKIIAHKIKKELAVKSVQ
ncbi:MAG: hypothetical protein JZU65_06915 [Chlorobium sp.]|nr:hypothetical protein [Chlorobium sp.]